MQNVVVGRAFFELENSSAWAATKFCIGPILFLPYTDDFEETVATKILKCSDEAKLFQKNSIPGNEQQNSCKMILV